MLVAGFRPIDMLFGVAVLILLATTVAAHIIWVGRLIRAPGLRALSGAAQVLIVSLAASVPVAGFYAAAIVGRRRDESSRHGGRPARLIAVPILWTLAFAAAGASGQPIRDRRTRRPLRATRSTASQTSAATA